MAKKGERIRREAMEHIIFPGAMTREDLERAGPLILEKGEGLYVWDIEGNRYLDAGASGVYSVSVGYGRDEIARAARKQMAQLHFFTALGAATPVAVKFAKKLAEVTPGDLNAAFMSNDGSEAIETAFKIVRQYFIHNGPDKRRYKIIARRHGYHGNTLGAVAATDAYHPMRQMNEPLPPGYYFAAAPYCYRCEYDLEYPNCNLECASSVEIVIRSEGPEQVAAVVGETVLGPGGMIPPAPEYWPKVREICDKYGVFLIDDEVVCGFGRTGKWFGVEHYGVLPDVMAMAKGVSASYMPLAATAVRRKIADNMPFFWATHTYCHHPVASAVGLKTIEIIERENLVANAAEMGAYLLNQMKGLAGDHPTIGEARGLGLMAALEFVKDRRTREPFGAKERFALHLVEECRKRGVLIRQAEGTMLEFTPCLTINKTQIDDILSVVDGALGRVEKEYGF